MTLTHPTTYVFFRDWDPQFHTGASSCTPSYLPDFSLTVAYSPASSFIRPIPATETPHLVLPPSGLVEYVQGQDRVQEVISGTSIIDCTISTQDNNGQSTIVPVAKTTVAVLVTAPAAKPIKVNAPKDEGSKDNKGTQGETTNGNTGGNTGGGSTGNTEKPAPKQDESSGGNSGGGSAQPAKDGESNTNSGGGLGGVLADTISGGTMGQAEGQESQSGSGGGNAGSGSENNPQPVAVDVGGQQVNVNAGSNGAVVLGGQTVEAGQVATINGVAVSVPAAAPGQGAASAVIIGVATQAIAPAPTSGSLVDIGGKQVAVRAGSNGAIVVDGLTVQAGQVATINGVIVSAPSAAGTGQATALVINGITQAVRTGPTAAALLTLGSQTITANPAGAFVISGSTLTPGGVATIGGSTISLASLGGVVVINGQTQTLGSAVPPAGPNGILTIGGTTYSPIVSAGKTVYSISPGVTLTAGDKAVTWITDTEGKTILLAGSASVTLPSNSTTSSTSKSSTSSTITHMGDAVASGLGISSKAAAATAYAREIGGSVFAVIGVLEIILM
jgi:hypothetical protein